MSTRSRRAPKTAESTPTPVADLGCWFLGPNDGVDLPLVGDHTITIKSELEAGEDAQLLDQIHDEVNLGVGFEQYRLHKVAMYLQDWSLDKPIREMSVERRLAMLRGEVPEITLRESAFTRIYEAIVSHEKARPVMPQIVPVDVILTDAWFLGPDDAMRLALPGDQWMVVRAELDAGARAKIFAGLHIRGDGQATNLNLALARAAAYIVKWSLTYPDGRPVPVGPDSIKAMRSSRFGIIRRTIEAYEKALEARATNPIGAPS